MIYVSIGLDLKSNILFEMIIALFGSIIVDVTRLPCMPMKKGTLHYKRNERENLSNCYSHFPLNRFHKAIIKLPMNNNELNTNAAQKSTSNHE